MTSGTVTKPACSTCNDNGLIGGPSYHQPDEGGVDCPDCTPLTKEQTIKKLMELADEYANKSFDQGLSRRTRDEAPEDARRELEKALESAFSEREA